MDEQLEVGNEVALESTDSTWHSLEQLDIEPLTADEIATTQYVFGKLDHPTPEERAHYAEVYDSSLREKAAFQEIRQEEIKKLNTRSPELFWDIYAHDYLEVRDYVAPFAERFSDEDLSNFAKRFDAKDEGCFEDFVRYTANTLGISFADQIEMQIIPRDHKDATETDYDMMWNSYDRRISILDKTLKSHTSHQIMTAIMHELFHAKQDDIRDQTIQYTASRLGYEHNAGDYADNADNYSLIHEALKLQEEGSIPEEYKRGVLYGINHLNYVDRNEWLELGDSKEMAFGHNPYRAQITEIEAYTFQERISERLHKIEPISLLEQHASERDREVVDKSKDTALRRIFSPQDLLLINDFIHDPLVNFRVLDDIAHDLTATKRIEYLESGADFGNDYFGITIPEGTDTSQPVFRERYFKHLIKYAIDMRIDNIDLELSIDAYNADEQPSDYVSDFIDINALNVTGEPTRKKDMWTLALSASLNRGGYESGQLWDQFDAMMKAAKRSPKERIKYALNKRLASRKRAN